MLHKILTSKDTHQHAIVSVKPGFETSSYSDENQFIVTTWHSPIQNFQKYSVSIPQTSEIINTIRNTSSFGVNFLSKQNFENISHNLTNTNSKINLFKLEIFEDQKIKNPIISNALAHIDCKLDREMQVGKNIIFTGTIIGSMFNKNA